MHNWNLPWIVCLCGALGCTKSTVDPPALEREARIRGRKGDSPAGIVVAKPGEDRCQAKVGQAVHFPFGYVVIPGPPTGLTSKVISSLKVEVDGVKIHDPEVFSPEAIPGNSYIELIYVFRPKSRGAYRVKVTPVYDPPEKEEARVCVVDVSE